MNHRFHYTDTDAFFDLAKLLIACNCISILLMSICAEIYKSIKCICVKLGWTMTLVLMLLNLCIIRVGYVHGDELAPLLINAVYRILNDFDTYFMLLRGGVQQFVVENTRQLHDLLQIFIRLVRPITHDEL